MNNLVLKLIILLVPGAITTIIYGKLVIHNKWDKFDFIKLSILFGLSTYLFLQVIIWFINFFPYINLSNLTIWTGLENPKIIPNIQWTEVIFALISGILLGFITAIIENKKLIFYIAKTFNISQKYGDESLFYRTISNKDVDWVYLRDIDKNLIYSGQIRGYNETDSIYQIKLENVTVYTNKEAKELYRIKSILIAIEKNKLLIEIIDPKRIKNINIKSDSIH